MDRILTKESFVSLMEFIESQRNKANKVCDALEELNKESRCDLFLYADYEDKVLNILETMFDDTTDLIGYRMYDYPELPLQIQEAELKENPEVRSWETVYDYLIEKLNKKEKQNGKRDNN